MSAYIYTIKFNSEKLVADFERDLEHFLDTPPQQKLYREASEVKPALLKKEKPKSIQIKRRWRSDLQYWVHKIVVDGQLPEEFFGEGRELIETPQRAITRCDFSIYRPSDPNLTIPMVKDFFEKLEPSIEVTADWKVGSNFPHLFVGSAYEHDFGNGNDAIRNCSIQGETLDILPFSYLLENLKNSWARGVFDQPFIIWPPSISYKPIADEIGDFL